MKMAVQNDSSMTYSCSFRDRVVEVALVLVGEGEEELDLWPYIHWLSYTVLAIHVSFHNVSLSFDVFWLHSCILDIYKVIGWYMGHP